MKRRRAPILVSVACGFLWLGSCTDAKNENPGGGGAGGGGGGGHACGAASPLALAACVEQSRYEDDLRYVARERPPGSAHHQAVQALCAARFAEHGFSVELHGYGTGVNVIGVKPGASDERVLVSAHYDHIPGCAGADDNATGVAAVLESARVLGQASFERTLVVACWDEEELGLVGAEAYAARALASGEAIAGVFVYEMLGYTVSEPNTQALPFGFEAVFPEATARVAENDYAGDFFAVIGDDAIAPTLSFMESAAVELDVRAITLAVAGAFKNDPAFGDLQRSDHAPFWRIDVPALFITDTSEFRYAPYHCRNGATDVVDNLDHAFASGAIRLTTAAIADMLGVR